jgi:predicted nucleic acid-binding protein
VAGFLPDTGCMIAAVCAWHERHAEAAGEIGGRLRAAEPMFLAAPALVESYAVLTRLPPPHRMDPATALRAIEGSFVGQGRTIGLDGRSYPVLIRRLADMGIVGGRVYDAVIAACALREAEVALLTFNEGDFVPFAAWGLRIIVPGQPRS